MEETATGQLRIGGGRDGGPEAKPCHLKHEKDKLQEEQPASELPSEVMMPVSPVELVVFKWQEQEISLSGPHSRSTWI